MREFVEWSDELSVGVEEIDNQHKVLVGMLNELNTAVDGGWGQEARKEVINKLVEYTRVHFATEESLMTVSQYPHSEQHRKQHGTLIAEVQDHVKRFESDPGYSSYELIFFLKGWLIGHIMQDDKAFGAHLVRQGTGAKKKSWLRRLFGS